MSNYLNNLRVLIGTRKVIHPAARIIIENDRGEILFIRRTDDDRWGLPAGGLEEGEDIESCIRREVQEETGLELHNLQVIGISSRPDRESVIYPNGDKVQYFVVEFHCDQWSGAPRPDGIEVADARFLPPEIAQDLPHHEWSTFESLIYFQTKGQVRVR